MRMLSVTILSTIFWGWGVSACGDRRETPPAPSRLLDCGGGGDGAADGTDGEGAGEVDNGDTAYALSGDCGPADMGQDLIGEIGSISVGDAADPRPPALLSDLLRPSAPNTESPESFEVSLVDPLLALNFSADILAEIKRIGLARGKSNAEIAAELEQLAKRMAADHWRGAPGSRQNAEQVMHVMNLAHRFDPESYGVFVEARLENVTETGSGSATETVAVDRTALTAQGEASIGANSAAVLEVIGIDARVAVGVENKVESSSETRSITRTVNDPPRVRSRVVLTEIMRNGQSIPVYPLVGLDAGADGAASSLGLREPGTGGDHGTRLDPDTQERRRLEHERARRLAERQRRQRLLEDAIRRELESLRDSWVIFYVVSEQTQQLVRVEPQHVSSLNYLYRAFPRFLKTASARYGAARRRFETAAATSRQSDVAMRAYLRTTTETLTEAALPTARLQQLLVEVSERKAAYCPRRSLERERLALELALADLEELAARFRAHAGVVGDFVPHGELFQWLDGRLAELAGGRALLAAAPAAADACGPFDELHAAVVQRIAANRAAAFDQAAAALSDEAMAILTESNRRMRAVDSEAAYLATAHRLAERIQAARLGNRLTEAEFAARDAEAVIGDLRLAIAGSPWLTAADQQRLSAAVAQPITREVERLRQQLAVDTVGGFVFLRHAAVQRRLQAVRQLVAETGLLRASMLMTWRGLAAAAGLRVAPGCFASDAALAAACWTIEYPWERATDADLRRFDADLGDLERLIDQLVAAE